MDVFISYNWKVKEKVKELYKILTEEYNLKVWLDDMQLNGGNMSSLTAELASAIKNSKIFICCLTNQYCRSQNCNLEIEYASVLQKKIIVLSIDDLDTTKIDEIQITGSLQYSGIGFIITYLFLILYNYIYIYCNNSKLILILTSRCIRINCYESSNSLIEKKQTILKAIFDSLKVIYFN